MITSTRLSVVRLATLLPLLVPAGIVPGPPAIAQQSAASAGGSFVDCSRALNETIRSGTPTVVVITSRAVPESLALRDRIARDLLGSSIGRQAMFAEMPVELFADRVERLGTRQYPTLLAYGGKEGSLVRLGQLAGPTESVQVAAWLGSIGLSGGGGALPLADPAVAQTGLIHRDRGEVVAVPAPSPQQPMQAPPAPQKPQPPAYGMVPTGQVAAPAMSQVVMQESGPPVVVQPQSPSIYIQPQAPRIYLGQMPAPEITIVQGAPGAPSVNYAVAGPQPQAPPNLFAVPQQPVASPQLSPSPQAPVAMTPEVSYGYAAPPTEAVLMTAAPAAGMAVAPQQSVVGTTAIAILLQNPDLLNAMIGALGKGFSLLGHALEKHGYPRVRMPKPEPAPASGTLALVPGMALPQAATVPIMTVPVTQQAPPQLIPAPQVPPAVIPSPQSPPQKHHGFFSGGNSHDRGRPWWKK